MIYLGDFVKKLLFLAVCLSGFLCANDEIKQLAEENNSGSQQEEAPNFIKSRGDRRCREIRNPDGYMIFCHFMCHSLPETNEMREDGGVLATCKVTIYNHDGSVETKKITDQNAFLLTDAPRITIDGENSAIIAVGIQQFGLERENMMQEKINDVPRNIHNRQGIDDFCNQVNELYAPQYNSAILFQGNHLEQDYMVLVKTFEVNNCAYIALLPIVYYEESVITKEQEQLIKSWEQPVGLTGDRMNQLLIEWGCILEVMGAFRGIKPIFVKTKNEMEVLSGFEAGFKNIMVGKDQKLGFIYLDNYLYKMHRYLLDASIEEKQSDNYQHIENFFNNSRKPKYYGKIINEVNALGASAD